MKDLQVVFKENRVKIGYIWRLLEYQRRHVQYLCRRKLRKLLVI